MSKALGFIGLGVMGFPMAGHLANQNNNISVFNRTSEKSKIWNTKYTGVICKSPAEIAKLSDVIMICIGNDSDVRDVILGKDGMINCLKQGSIIVDHTTTSSDLSMEINGLLNPNDIFYIDAPVSGGEAGAQSGQLSIMAGGDKAAFNSIENILIALVGFVFFWIILKLFLYKDHIKALFLFDDEAIYFKNKSVEISLKEKKLISVMSENNFISAPQINKIISSKNYSKSHLT